MTVRPARPPASMRRLHWKRASFASLDFEATGLDFARDTIISFGVVPITNGRIDVGECAYDLVDPGDVPQRPETIVVHGLRPIDLSDAPSLDAARESLAAALDGRFLVTWYAIVEAAFLDKLFGGGVRSWLRRCVDVRNLVLSIERDDRGGVPEGVDTTLSGVAERYDIPVASPHNALDDALVTAQLFLVVASRMTTAGTWDVAKLIRASAWEQPRQLRPGAPI